MNLKFSSSSASKLDLLLEQHDVAAWMELGLEQRSSFSADVITSGTYGDNNGEFKSLTLSLLLLVAAVVVATAAAELARPSRALLVLTPTWAISITAISTIPLHFLTISLSPCVEFQISLWFVFLSLSLDFWVLEREGDGYGDDEFWMWFGRLGWVKCFFFLLIPKFF